jgi:hypothetical protein
MARMILAIILLAFGSRETPASGHGKRACIAVVHNEEEDRAGFALKGRAYGKLGVVPVLGRDVERQPAL